jgi:hypothetical protein
MQHPDRDFDDDDHEDDGEAYYDQLYKRIGPEWARDHAEQLSQEHYEGNYEQAVKEFTSERLQSYYLADPKLAVSAFESLDYARSLMPLFPRAALVFAATATELAVKTVLLKPIIFGLVHTEELASFIAEMTTKQMGIDRFQGLLAEILSQFGGVELKTLTRENSSTTLWQEIKEVQETRNAVVHRGETANEAKTKLAISVSETLLNEIFPNVLRNLELHLDDSMSICRGSVPSPPH